MKGPNLI